MISFFFLGIEELAIQLEEPFSVLPLANIAGGIGKSADEHVEWLDELLTRKGELWDESYSNIRP
jgi:putative membrane protein